jgi:hypothetical protein
MNGITTRLHWTDQPYRWHVNDGEEVFAVLETGDVFFADVGSEHVAYRAPARGRPRAGGRARRLGLTLRGAGRAATISRVSITVW